MKYIFRFCILILFSINLTASEPLTGTMAVLTNGIVDANRKDAIIAFTILINRVGYKNDMSGDLKYYNSEKKIINEYINNKIDYIIINPYFYLKNIDKLREQTAYYWSIRKYKTKFQKMIIVTSVDSNINTINDLKNKSIMIKEDNYMGKVVLDKELLKTKHILSKNYINTLTKTNKHSTAILKTYFRKVDAAIIPLFAYTLVCEMNPAVNRKLKIIYQTDELFMPIINLLNIKTSKEMLNRMKRTSQNLNKTYDGKNIFSLFKMSGIDAIGIEELEPLIKYYEEYKYLKNKYGYKNDTN